MSQIPLLRLLAALLSLGILAASGYLLWSWHSGYVWLDADGLVHRKREDWRLWTGGALLIWSFVGRSLTPLLLARGDHRKTRPERRLGEVIEGPAEAKLYVERHGRMGAPSIIFTHGWGMDSTFWSYAREDLSDRFRLHFWDLPGLGKSKISDAEITVETLAGALESVIESVGGQRPVLVGHSIGGMAIQTLLRDTPQIQKRLSGVVLLNTTYTNPLRTMVLSKILLALQKPVIEPSMRLGIMLKPIVWLAKWQSYLSGSAHMAQRLGYGNYVTRSQLEHTTLLATRASPSVLAKGDLAMLRWDATGAMAGLQLPCLVVGADKDIVTKLEANRAIASQDPRVRFEIVEGANHMGPMERADYYNGLIAEFALAVQNAASDDSATSRPRSGVSGRWGEQQAPH
jgi:pimeloyl-ACP methyl ester carboxylesterase